MSPTEPQTAERPPGNPPTLSTATNDAAGRESKEHDRDFYMHGDNPTTLRRWAGRTAASSAAYLLPRLRPDTRLLDLGCGPGTITLDLATRVPEGAVHGVDIGHAAIAQARAAAAARAARNVSFAVASAYALPFDDDTFDVLHAHQVFPYLRDAPSALAEAARVLRPGGVIALRDALFDEAAVEPRHPGLLAFLRACSDSFDRTGSDRCIARRLPALLRGAGLRVVARSASTVLVSGTQLPAFAADWVEMLTESPMLDAWRRFGVVDAEKEELLREGMRALGQAEDGFILWPALEVIAEKPVVED